MRLVSLALIMPRAYELRDPSVRDVCEMPRPDALRACEASDPVESSKVVTGKKHGFCGMVRHVEPLVPQL